MKKNPSFFKNLNDYKTHDLAAMIILKDLQENNCRVNLF